MMLAPDMTNTTLSRRQRHLRTQHDALTKSSTRQKLMTPTKYRANYADIDKSNPAIGQMGPVQRVWQIRVKAPASRKSP